MQVQNFGFLPFGNGTLGTSTPGTANTGTAGSVNPNADGASSAATGGSSSNDDSSLASIGGQLSSALSTALTTNVAELAVVRESESLKIQLTDGTQVRIRVRAQGAALGAAQTQPDGSSSLAATVFSSGQLQVSVSGNLSSADQQAISDVVAQVNSLAGQFFSGDAQDAFAAAASLNIDPAEIASFSMKLSYSSSLFQQTAATGAAPGSGAGSSPVAAAGGQSTSGGATGTASSTGDPSSADGNTISPQQVIINFVQHVMTRLGRAGSSGSDSHLGTSSRWKLHLLAQALPAYAQAQAGAAAQGTASQGTASQGAALAPQVPTNRYPTLGAGPGVFRAARLAADTLSQLAQ
jgi:hypothetical protein